MDAIEPQAGDKGFCASVTDGKNISICVAIVSSQGVAPAVVGVRANNLSIKITKNVLSLD
jgi:hypothetical protein